MIAHFTDKTVDEIKFFHRIIFSQKYDDVVFSFKLITKISKIQIAAVGKYFIKKYFLKEEIGSGRVFLKKSEICCLVVEYFLGTWCDPYFLKKLLQ